MIIETKLFIPKTRGKLITRPHLNERLNEGLRHKLTLVTAPAGYGKSTLLSEWTTTVDAHIAWISLDEGDNNPVRFWTHTIGALRRAFPTFSEKWEQRPPEVELYGNTHIAIMINLLHRLSEQTVLIWDDFHIVKDTSILNGVSYLIKRLPPHVHFFMVGRSRPPLSLSRLRVEGHLIELGSDDLRFGIEETKAFFTECTDLSFNSDELMDIYRRTEGWAAGMRMAALAMARTAKETKPILNMTGKLRHVADYFFEEVLIKQSQNIQQFLLKTSILERMNAALCKAVTHTSDSLSILRQLEQENLFLVSLDHEREWFRYHHLFKEFLYQQLQMRMPEQVKSLHEAAGRWLEENGFAREALEHYLTGERYAHALQLLERMLPLLPNYEWTTSHRWLNRIPDALLFQKPTLFLMNIASLYFSGHISEATHKYWWAVGTLESDANLLSQTEKHHFEAGLDFLVAFRSFLEKDFESFIEYAGKYLQRDPDGGFLPDFGIERDGYHPIWDIYLSCESESLLKAEETLRTLLDMWRETRNRLFFAHLCLDYAMVLYERNRLKDAEQYARKARTIGTEYDNRSLVVRASLMMAQIALIIHRTQTADRIIKHLLADVDKHKVPRLAKEIELFQMRYRLKRGKLKTVTQWVNDNGFSVSDEIPFAMTEEYDLFARILGMQGKKSEAMDLTNHLLALAAKGKKHRDMIRYTILKSRLFAQQNQMVECFQTLEDALALAIPNGYFRIFLDEGKPLESLLRQYVQAIRNHHFERSEHVRLDDVKRLLEAMVRERAVETPEDVQGDVRNRLLTHQEKKVLKLMNKGLSNKQIANELGVSLSTVKTHIHHLYRKLAVRNRMSAIKKAKELKLLSD